MSRHGTSASRLRSTRYSVHLSVYLSVSSSVSLGFCQSIRLGISAFCFCIKLFVKLCVCLCSCYLLINQLTQETYPRSPVTGVSGMLKKCDQSIHIVFGGCISGSIWCAGRGLEPPLQLDVQTDRSDINTLINTQDCWQIQIICSALQGVHFKTEFTQKRREN